ncbi:hypothetical protein CIB48_g4304 [Xylaria polymorpha]|nr:hypothetical protein CIB48_g4304 [Xylaria polymorpha]
MHARCAGLYATLQTLHRSRPLGSSDGIHASCTVSRRSRAVKHAPRTIQEHQLDPEFVQLMAWGKEGTGAVNEEEMARGK